MIYRLTGPMTPCAVEFWVMSTLLPLGIAIFQAANSQFLYVAFTQRKYAHLSRQTKETDSEHWTSIRSRPESSIARSSGLFQRFKVSNIITRVTIVIAAGIVLTIISTFIIYFGSRKFHPHFGFIPDNFRGNDTQRKTHCKKGWECLPASPLWLAALYIPAFESVNKYFAPPLWFAVSIFVMQLMTVLSPCFEIWRQRSLQAQTKACIQAWDHGNSLSGSFQFQDPKISTIYRQSFITSVEETTPEDIAIPEPCEPVSPDMRRGGLFTDLALQHTLRLNPAPLQKFAALHDFSGENISFLVHVAEWQKPWVAVRFRKQAHAFILPSERAEEERKLRYRQFWRAVHIYMSFVNMESAEFPINLSSKIRKGLDAVFGDATILLLHRHGQGTLPQLPELPPLVSDTDNAFIDPEQPRLFSLDGIDDKITEPGATSASAPLSVSASRVVSPAPSEVNSRANIVVSRGTISIPEIFDENVFGEATSVIRYLVLTNTWPKFVNYTLRSNQRTSQPGRPQSRIQRWFPLA
ncbi:hypothetical protein AYL99_10201 [Fonsecaea erecta]|uniref:RGS domain-containing protein n=1 Tax=Fonsecaea erecta TaxID=1367422 RepID=A0A178Z8D6_9EURO|nr:hypothetical protein AYL99_10201 [Fonsecaea erecta]OAP56049.1 hypothetical protein AYL99_10201 [Fonsecaea erecta]